MPIPFPTSGLTDGQEYSPPGIPGVKYTYNAAKGVWVGAQAGSGSSYTLPTAGVGTGGTLGGVKVDGTSVTISSGVISATSGGGPIAVLNFNTNALNPPWTSSSALPALTVNLAQGASVSRVTGSVPGRYLVTFTTPRSDTNYTAIATLGWDASHSPPDTLRDNADYYILNQTTSSFEVYVNDTHYPAPQPMDTDNIGIAVFDTTSIARSGGGGGSSSSSGSVCQAWVNFDGTTTPPLIRASFNVGSITKIAGGNYEISFINQLQDANYAVLVSTNNGNTGDGWPLLDTATVVPTRSLFRIGTGKEVGSGYRDRSFINVVVYR